MMLMVFSLVSRIIMSLMAMTTHHKQMATEHENDKNEQAPTFTDTEIWQKKNYQKWNKAADKHFYCMLHFEISPCSTKSI
jgi:hypothetical protein